MMMKLKKNSENENLKQIYIDPYEMLTRKLKKMSWNGLSDPEYHLDKSEVIVWFSLFREYSDEVVASAMIEGILNNQFHNISYILNLVQSDSFREISSMDAYKLLYKFVSCVPKAIEEWMDDSDLAMSQNVLALLSQSHQGGL
ncbi:hypothetical protein U3C50_001529 [Providencia rettgeri]|nr:hypothetical protein [Providencia rettgeri]